MQVGIVGLGFGYYGHLAAFRKVQRYTVAGVCAGSIQKAEEVAEIERIPRVYANWQELVQDPHIDAVSIATPPGLQPAIAEAALKRGKAVFAEKLLAPTVAEAVRLSALARSTGLPNMVNFLFPELDTWRRARQALAGGGIGQPRHLNLQWCFESYDNQRARETWKTDPLQGGGVLSHFGIHCLHHLEWLAGPIGSLFAVKFKAPDLGGSDHFAVVAVQFAAGCSGTVTLSNAATFSHCHRVTIYGTEGCIDLVNTEPDPVAGFHLAVRTGRSDRRDQHYQETFPGKAKQTPVEWPPRNRVDSRVPAVTQLVKRFADWSERGHCATPSFQDGMRAVVLLDSVCRSAESGTWVSVPNGSTVLAKDES